MAPRTRLRSLFPAALAVAGLSVVAACSGGSGNAAPAPEATVATTVAPSLTTCPAHVDPPVEITTIDAVKLVPTDGLGSVLVCRYSGMNTPGATPGTAGDLQQGAMVSDPATVAALAVAVNDGPPLLSGKHSCPMADGRSYELTFQYPSGLIKSVDVEASGCRSVQDKTKAHAATEALIAQLTAIVGAPA